MNPEKPISFFSTQKTTAAIKQDFLQRVELLLERGNFILGKEVEEFEHSFAAFTGSKFAIGVSNGLDAIKLSLKSLGIGPGDEVIVPAHTFIATWLAVSETGARPIAVDADPLTKNLNYSTIERAISIKTKAIIPVHMHGLPCNMDEISSIATRHNLFIVEDYSQAQGAKYKGQRTGSFGHVNASSLYPSKNLGAIGDAGIITTNDENIRNKLVQLRSYGSEKKYEHLIKGYNARLDTIQAIYLSLGLSRLDEWNEERRLIAGRYNSNLKELKEIILPASEANSESVFHHYVITVDKRDQLQSYLSNEGISTLIHYPIPPHLQEAYKSENLKAGSFPTAEKLAANVLSLPIYPGLTFEQVDYVCGKITKWSKQQNSML